MNWLRNLSSRLAVTPAPVGAPNDGINRPITGATQLDRAWGEHHQNNLDSLEAWRANPLARRLINLITAYVIGDGIQITSNNATLQTFIADFSTRGKNRLLLRQPELCSELTRSGELFILLFPNPVDGIPQLRAVSAIQIDQLTWQNGDYETEHRYHQTPDNAAANITGTWWSSPDDPNRQPGAPVMLHYAINRPVGALRGEGDLVPILPWLRRYTRWLEDRVRLNAGVRAFLWVVKAAKNLVGPLKEQYRMPPEPGSVIIAEQGAEEWTAVAPSLNANDASHDGRAIRWMITAGGPGTGLIDFGEGEDSNLASATAMQEQRRRFLRQRQTYFAWILADIILNAWRLYAEHNGLPDTFTAADLTIDSPEISPEDSARLAAAVKDLSGALATVQGIVGISDAFKRLTLRLFAKFAGESIGLTEADAIIAKGTTEESHA